MVPPFLPTLAADFTTESTAFSVLCIQTQRQRHTETNTHTHERKLKTQYMHTQLPQSVRFQSFFYYSRLQVLLFEELLPAGRHPPKQPKK
jgi:hypothetical protein